MTTLSIAPPAAMPTATFARTLKAELTKLYTLRSTWLMIAISISTTIGIAALACADQASSWNDMTPKARLAFDATSQSLVGVLFATLILGSVAVRSITSEYTSGMIRVTFAAISRRRQVLAAKAIALAASAVAVTLVGNALAYILGQAILSSKHIESKASDPGVVKAIFFGAIAVSLFTVIGLALGTMMRRTAAATTTLALLVIGGQLLAAALPRGARRFLPSSALESTVTVVRTSDMLSPGAALLTLLTIAVIAQGIAKLLLARRDA
jgi:ABC-type transport system involved in multi-copper enzyme maturation permease subunit